MSKIRDWLTGKKRAMKRYEEDKKEFEKVMGKPKITITVDLPEGMEEMKKEFADLEDEKRFKDEVEELVKKRLQEIRDRKREE